MSGYCLRYVTVILFLMPSTSFAEPPELLIAVSGQEKSRVLAENDYFLKRDGYSANRFRIVRVNTDLLLGKEENLTLSLFDDISFPVVRDEIIKRNGGTNFTWRGRFASPPFTADDLAQLNANHSPRMNKALYDSLFNLKIVGTQYVFERDPARAEAVAGMRHDPSTGGIAHEKDRLARKLNDGTVIYDVLISVPSVFFPLSKQRGHSSTSFSYQLRSLPMDRRYSVVYEVDPARYVPLGDSADSQTLDQARRIREYREFIESLGENPLHAVQSVEGRP